MIVRLDAQLKAVIDAAVRDAYPHEGCGFLLGEGDEAEIRVREVRPATNAREDSPHNRYLIQPEEFLRAIQDAESNPTYVTGVTDEYRNSFIAHGFIVLDANGNPLPRIVPAKLLVPTACTGGRPNALPSSSAGGPCTSGVPLPRARRPTFSSARAPASLATTTHTTLPPCNPARTASTPITSCPARAPRPSRPRSLLTPTARSPPR